MFFPQGKQRGAGEVHAIVDCLGTCVGFMTSALQTYARKTMIAIDTLTFRTEVRVIKVEDCHEAPDIGRTPEGG